MIKISIVIPVYNVEKYLDDTFLSLVNQSLKEIEIIAVNDGSTDKSLDIIKRYAEKDQRIRHVTQENKGQSAARNLGLKYVRGEFVYFMDADDVIECHALEECYRKATELSADICIFDADIIYDKNSKDISWDYHQTRFLDNDSLYDGTTVINMMMDNARYNSVVWLYLVRKEFLLQTGISFYEGIIHEDELFTTLLFIKCDSVCCIKKNFVQHRIRNNSTMGKTFSARNMDCYLTVMDELRRFGDLPIINRYMRFTLPIVFYRGHILPFRDKLRIFWRAVKSGYIRFIGIKSIIVFWLKGIMAKTA